MENLSHFNISTYSSFLKKFEECGFSFRLVSTMNNNKENKVVFLRHDIDLHICMVKQMAQLESSMNISATYFVPLTLHFNVLYPDNRQILLDLIKLGHAIGLHYDLETYPVNSDEARKHLDWEIDILSNVIKQEVNTIAMHQPHKGAPDQFRCINEYVNPHDPRYQNDISYISDSCRAWRDETLLSFFGANPPSRLLLTTHPELWLDGSIGDRIVYLDKVLIKRGMSQQIDYFNNNVRNVWLNHPAPILHDKRESSRSNQSAFCN